MAKQKPRLKVSRRSLAIGGLVLAAIGAAITWLAWQYPRQPAQTQTEAATPSAPASMQGVPGTPDVSLTPGRHTPRLIAEEPVGAATPASPEQKGAAPESGSASQHFEGTVESHAQVGGITAGNVSGPINIGPGPSPPPSSAEERGEADK